MVNIDGYYLYLNIDVHIMSIGDEKGYVTGNTKRCFGSLFGSLFGARVRLSYHTPTTQLLPISTAVMERFPILSLFSAKDLPSSQWQPSY